MSNCCSAFGIDLGTTNSVGCIFKAGKLEVLCSMNSERTFPSYVAFPSNGRPVFMVGKNAKNRMKTKAKEVIHDVKRLFGVEYDSDIVKNMKKSCAFEIDKDEKGRPVVVYTQNKQRYTKYPQEISSYVLSDIGKAMKAFAGFDIKDVVITVPAYFNSYQRRLTEEAATIAGLNTIKIITEPEAAAFAYSDINIADQKERTILIYDLGGGTFDVTIMKTNGLKFEELALDGDLLLGGSDFDTVIMNECMKNYEQERGEPFPKNRLGKLRADCEAAKVFLMSQTETTVECDSCDFEWTLTRARMESLLEEMIERTLTICERAMKAANCTKESIDDVVFVGGSTRMLLVENMVTQFFGKTIKHTINPDECVAYGAAKYALYLTLHPELRTQPSSEGGVPDDDLDYDLIPEQPIPEMDKEIKKMGEDMIGDMEISTICYGSVGIADAKMRMNTMIRKGRRLPYSNSIELRNHEANMTELSIPILLGEHSHARRNKIIKRVTITDIKPKPKGENSFYMFFNMDIHGSLSIRVIDNDTGKDMIIKDVEDTMSRKNIKELRNDLQSDIEKNEVYNVFENRKNDACARALDLLRKKPEFTDQLDMLSEQIKKAQSEEELTYLEQQIEVYQLVVCYSTVFIYKQTSIYCTIYNLKEEVGVVERGSDHRVPQIAPCLIEY